VKKLLAGGALAALTLGGIVVGAVSASAHVPGAEAGCDAAAGASFVSATANMYPAGASVVVTIDDAEVESGTFEEVGYKSGQNQPQYEYSYENKWDTLDATVAHTWTVSYDSPDGQGVKDFGGTIEPCVTAEPSPEPPAPSEPPVTEPSEEPSVAPTDEASVPPVPVPSDEPSASPSPAAEEPPVLAATGATVGGAVAFAALLAAGGVALVWARKRMQSA
jgi:outer membrane biosynthesis protein TonB